MSVCVCVRTCPSITINGPMHSTNQHVYHQSAYILIHADGSSKSVRESNSRCPRITKKWNWPLTWCSQNIINDPQHYQNLGQFHWEKCLEEPRRTEKAAGFRSELQWQCIQGKASVHSERSPVIKQWCCHTERTFIPPLDIPLPPPCHPKVH